MAKIHSIVSEVPVDSLWIWVSTDGSDRLFDRYITSKCSSTTYALVGMRGIVLLVSELDGDIAVPFEKEVYRNKEELDALLRRNIERYDWPNTIFLNYSESGDPKVDSLGHGVFLKLGENISQFYVREGFATPEFVSAEELFYVMVERRSEDEIEKAKLAAKRAVYIMKESFSRVREGMSEHDIARLFHEVAERTREDFSKEHLVEREEYSWDKESCPIILVGPNLAKGGHAETSDYKLQKGETLYADFGVKLFFLDGLVVSSDLQRMAYLPRDGETRAPSDVQKVFDTLYTSISAGLDKLRPGNRGSDVDDAARGVIVSANYPDYNHATGHPIAEVAHSPGTLLGPAGNQRTQRKIQPAGTYTIEPRCQIVNGGSIEEMVVAMPSGGQTLCERQSELWIIGINI